MKKNEKFAKRWKFYKKDEILQKYMKILQKYMKILHKDEILKKDEN